MIQYYGAPSGTIEPIEKAFYIVGVDRAMIVLQPAGWEASDRRAFIQLMDEVEFGVETYHLVVLWIEGTTLIINPAVEVRAMGDFEPYLIRSTMNSERIRIKKFFEEHPVVGTGAEDIPAN